jgi:hypothetical protein
MFVISDADAAAIRAVFRQRGELSAIAELRRLFPGLDAETARECTRTIAGWVRGIGAASAASISSQQLSRSITRRKRALP